MLENVHIFPNAKDESGRTPLELAQRKLEWGNKNKENLTECVRLLEGAMNPPARKPADTAPAQTPAPKEEPAQKPSPKEEPAVAPTPPQKAPATPTAEKEDAQTLYNRGLDYTNAQNWQEAAKCFRLAAEQGHADAQNYLGRCYSHGAGVPQDEQEATKWFRKAAEQGHKGAQSFLQRIGQ